MSSYQCFVCLEHVQSTGGVGLSSSLITLFTVLKSRESIQRFFLMLESELT